LAVDHAPKRALAVDCSPERLMRLVREGSEHALDQITRCYSERLLQAGRRHCRTTEEAEDAVQDALISAGARLGTLRDDERLEGWLVRVVASACRRLSRGQKNDARRHEPADDDAPNLVGDEDPEKDVARHELGRLLEQTLLTLSPTDRSILLLSELEDFSAAEIGAELDMTAGAVRTRLSRLRASLTATLEMVLGRAP
jgi:RNA polymerase sigma-70 factor (ECF subfamily)